MAVLLHPGSDGPAWLAALRHELPDTDIRLWPEVGDPDEVEIAVLSSHPAADLHRYPNLAAIHSLGAGVEQFTIPEMPQVTVVRLADPGMSDAMAAYATHWIVHFHRRFDFYTGHQADAAWNEQPSPAALDCPVGILGFGTIGRRVGEVVAQLGYPVHAWSRSGGDDEWVTHHRGEAELDEFLGASQIVVNVLPVTERTRGLLDAGRFDAFRNGGGLINIGRGATVDEAALLEALDDGRLGFAVLDVTAVEPLPPSSPLWRHPLVRITPHVAGRTSVSTASKVIAANIERILAGEEPWPIHERTRGY